MLSSTPPVTPPEGSEGSPSLLQGTRFTKTSQELIQFVTTLRSLGAQVFLDLPRIVVIGNQSAGKSSLVEAISGIGVPRDAGTCTRCPMECRLARDEDEWSCQIAIRWEFDDAGERLDDVREVPFGPRLTDKARVEPLLRQAQEAILSGNDNMEPGFEPSVLMSPGGKAKARLSARKALAFSKNTICVDLAGPDLVDLSFVDLPGIVANADEDIVKLVEDLVKSYVGGNCLILVALPMSDDIENQKAARIAKEADPHGLRTIGVLTKPDTLPPGSTKRRQLWLDVLEGREHLLQHGYYCTRQPDDDQRLAGISNAEARGAETMFFRTTSPWKEAACQHRFGTANLIKSISELLTRIISDSLPRLLGEVAAQLANTNAQLDQLPPAIATAPSAFVLDLVTKFQNDVFALVKGSPRHKRLVQTNKATYKRFKDAILGTAPAFLPYKNAEELPKGRKKDKWFKIEGEEMENVHWTTEELYLEDVRAHIRSSVTRELPNNIPYPAKKSLMDSFQQTWEAHVRACFERVQADFKANLGDLIKARFERFSHLKGVVGPAVMQRVSECSTETEKHMRTILEAERASPFTQNTNDLAEKNARQLTKYKRARAYTAGMISEAGSDGDTDTDGELAYRVSRPERTGPKPPSKLTTTEKTKLRDALAELTRLGYKVDEDDLAKLNPPDEYEEELAVMAEVRAYFQISYKRIIDYVPLYIDKHLMYALAADLQRVLIERLGLGAEKSDTRCAGYIAEDAQVVAMRTELLAKKKTLERVQRELFNFGL